LCHELAIRTNLEAAHELAREYGEPLEKAVLRLAYKEEIQDTVKVAILKAYNDALIAKESEQKVSINQKPRMEGPLILPRKLMEYLSQLPKETRHELLDGASVVLPEMNPDPAKLHLIEGGKE
jgi:hypothetical protein